MQFYGFHKLNLRSSAFLREFFAKTKPEERTWAKLVTLDTIHWYCDRPEPTLEAVKYDAKIRQRKSVILILFKGF